MFGIQILNDLNIYNSLNNFNYPSKKIILIIYYSYFFVLKQKISFLENKHFPSLDDLKL